MKRDDDDVRGAAAALGVSLDADQVRRLHAFAELLADRAVPLGMVAASDRDRLLQRHVVDSLRAATAVEDTDRLACDVGSGAGLPGIPVALARPNLTVELVEPRRARVAFLELAVEQLRLRNVVIAARRIEDGGPPADVCFARAFAPLVDAWEAALPRLRRGGRLVYFAGAAAAPFDPPPGCTSVEIVPAPPASIIESAGPLVIMTR